MAAGETGPAPDREPLLFLVGPTASGKSAVALELAAERPVEIVSLDSMLVYRGMDVGTAKPSAAARARVPHHALDLVEPSEAFTVHRYLREAERALREIRARGRQPLFVGGTALYMQALLRGLFEGPEVDRSLRAALEARARLEGTEALHRALAAVDATSAGRIHPRDEKRIVRALEVFEQTGRPLSDWQREWGWGGRDAPAGRPRRIVGIAAPTQQLDERIRRRTRDMLDAGWADEARAVRDGPGFGPTASQALGYGEVLAWVDGAIDRAECEQRIATRTRQFARRQRTWFRRFPEIEWLDAAEPSGVAALAARARERLKVAG
jgi:tRNA dimethylallyltransferase